MREVEAILEETSVFIDKLKNTGIYEEYRCAAEELRKVPELKALADAFRKERYRAYDALQEPVSFAAFADLEAKRLELDAYPEIKRYLQAEVALCRVLQEIQNRLTLAVSPEEDMVTP